MKLTTHLLTLIQALAAYRIRLAFENLALRQQIIVLKRTTTRARIEDSDHVIGLGERHLIKVLREFVDYFNESRCHLSLDGDAPEPRTIDNGFGVVTATAVLGGLHHTYSRAA